MINQSIDLMLGRESLAAIKREIYSLYREGFCVFKEARVLGLNLFTRPASLIAQAKETMLQLATEGKIKPLVGQTFPLAEAAEAQRFLMEERPFGRVVLTM